MISRLTTPLFTLMLVLVALTAHASSIQLPRTGQTDCIDGTGAVISCVGTGQDGDRQAGRPWPEPRFTDNSNGTVSDNLTGLVWLKDAGCFGAYGLAPAITAVNTLKGDGTLCGLSDGSAAGDWRVPDQLELLSMVNRGERPTLASGLPFTGIQASYLSSNSWVVKSDYTFKDVTGNIWPVRDGRPGTVQLPGTGQNSGVAWPEPRFTNNNNGTVTDNLTGLIWLQSANCKGDPTSWYKDIYEGVISWEYALSWSNNLSEGACNLSDGSIAGDWRLPNINELQSMVDINHASYYPAVPPGSKTLFSYLYSSGYWSSTNDLSNSIFYVNWDTGFISKTYATYGNQVNTAHAWPVRGGTFGNSLISLSPTLLDFTTTPVSWRTNKDITIKNESATSRMQVSAMEFSGVDASQFVMDVGSGSSGTCGRTTPIIPPSSSCTVTISFQPTTLGTKAANFRISTSAANTPNSDIPLSGIAVINGTCSSYDQQTLILAPTTDHLCIFGTPSTVTGTGPWNWSCTGENGGSDASCSASIQSYRVNFFAGTNGALSGTTIQTVSYGAAAAAVTALPNPHYHFVNWTGSLTSTSNPLTIGSVTSAMSLTANYVIDTFAVNYVSGSNGTILGNTGQTVSYGANSTTVTAVPASGYHFVNWTEGGTEVGTNAALNSTSVSASHNYTANFAINTYTVAFSPGANGTLSGTTSQTVNYGSSATAVTALPNPHYHFVNWTGSLTSTSNPLTIASVTSARNFTANFAIDTFTLTFISGGNGTLSNNTSQTVSYGGNATAVTAFPAVGYHFVNWTDDGGAVVGTNAALTILGASTARIYTANFAINSYAVNYTVAGHGTLTGNTTQTVNYGGNAATVTAVPDTDYHFVKWTDGTTIAGAAAALTGSNITSAHNYIANFAINTNPVTFTSGPNGTLAGATAQAVNLGADSTAVTAVPAQGYHFVNWTEGGAEAGTNPLLSIKAVTAPHSYTANFAINSYTVTFTSAGNGTLTGSASQTITHGGNSATVTAVPASGYHFVNWTEGTTPAGNSETLTVSNVSAVHSYTANFAVNTSLITFGLTGSGALTGSTSQTVIAGANATAVTAVPTTGYHFVNWTEGGKEISVNTVLNITNVTTPHNYTANFAINSYSLSFTSAGDGSLSGNLKQTLNYGDKATTVTAVPVANYHLVNWTEGATVVGTSPDLTVSFVNASHSFTANFAIDTFPLTFTASANGTLTGNTSQTVITGANASPVTAVPDTGYHFVNWTEEANIVSQNVALTPANITAAHVFKAHFAIDPVNGACGASNNGSFTSAPVSNLCSAGSTSIPIGSGPWTWKCSSTDGGTNAACSAKLQAYSVTSTTGALSSIAPSTVQTVNHGSTTRFTVTAAAGRGAMVTGCNGTLNGSVYTTGPISGDCSVTVNSVSRNARDTGTAQPSIADALKAFNSYSGRTTLSADEKIRYDVAPLDDFGVPVGNGVVDVADIILILRRTVGLGSW